MFSKPLTKTLLFATLMIRTFHNFKQSFRLLFRTKSGLTYFVDLTFNCTEHRLQTSGCLSKVKVFHFRSESMSTVPLQFGTPFVSIYKQDYIISYEEYSIFRINEKNKQQKNSVRLRQKVSYPDTVHVGIPIPISIHSIDEMFLNTNHRRKRQNKNENEQLPISYLIDLLYDIYKDKISNFRTVDNTIRLVYFKETTKNLNKINEEEIQNKKLWQNVFDWFNEKYKTKEPEEELYDFYEDLFNDSKFYPQELKLGVIVFIDRIELNNAIIKNKIKNDFNRNNDKFTVMPCYEDNLLLIVMVNKLFILYPNDGDKAQDYKLHEDFSPYLMGLYEVKKVEINGEMARNI